MEVGSAGAVVGSEVTVGSSSVVEEVSVGSGASVVVLESERRISWKARRQLWKGLDARRFFGGSLSLDRRSGSGGLLLVHDRFGRSSACRDEGELHSGERKRGRTNEGSEVGLGAGVGSEESVVLL
jgi:hypothetical protein